MRVRNDEALQSEDYCVWYERPCLPRMAVSLLVPVPWQPHVGAVSASKFRRSGSHRFF